MRSAGPRRRRSTGRPAARALLFALLIAISAACTTIRLVSDYDPRTDAGVSELQQRTGAHVEALRRLHLEPESCGHANFVGFYAEALVAVDGLLVRNRVRARNAQTTESLELLRDSLVTLEELHEAKETGRCMTPEELAPIKEALETSFSAILKLELAKKRGEEG